VQTDWGGLVGTYGRLDELPFSEFEEAGMENLINRFFGWEVDVLNDICPVDEC